MPNQMKYTIDLINNFLGEKVLKITNVETNENTPFILNKENIDLIFTLNNPKNKLLLDYLKTKKN